MVIDLDNTLEKIPMMMMIIIMMLRMMMINMMMKIKMAIFQQIFELGAPNFA